MAPRKIGEMVWKCLVCSLFLSFTAADVKPSAAAYLPPPPAQAAAVRSVAGAVKAQDVPDLAAIEIVENDLNSAKSVALTKEASKDPVYGFPGVFPGPFINQGQIYPHPGYPTGGFPGQVLPGPGLPPSQGSVNPALNTQGFPGQIPPGQGYPGQGFPSQLYPGQGFPGQVYPGQGFPGQGYPAQWFPGQGFINPGFAGQSYPNYPAPYSAPEQLKQEANTYNEDNKLRLRPISQSGTQYDAANGGYLYKKPTVAF